jgi:hypothetical protein
MQIFILEYLVLFIDNVDILKGDYGLFVAEETFTCRIRGYLIFVFLSSIEIFWRYRFVISIIFSMNERNFRLYFAFVVLYIDQKFGCKNV